MQDINNHHEEHFNKFEDEVREVLKPLNLPLLEKGRIVNSIVIIHGIHVRKEIDYIFDGIKELLTSDTGVGEQNR